VTEENRRWKVSYEIEGRYEEKSAFAGYHRIVTGSAPVLTIPDNAVVEDITPAPEYPNGTVIRRGPRPGPTDTYFKHGGVWSYAEDGYGNTPIVSLHDDDRLRHKIALGEFILIHQPE